MINTPLLLLLFVVVAGAEERLSWFTTDPEIRRSIFVPDNLAEGKEENRILPWVFHSNDETQLMQIKCIMRGYNASNNPSDYQEARWSHPGFGDSQVNTSAPPVKGEEKGVPYAIWTIEIITTAQDVGKKWATCEWQQGDFPHSTDFEFLIFRRLLGAEKEVLSYGLGEHLDGKDITQQVEDDIKRQISEHLNVPASIVSRSEDGQEFTVDKDQVLFTFWLQNMFQPGTLFQVPNLNDDGDGEDNGSNVDDNASGGGDVPDSDDVNANDGLSTGTVVLISLLVIGLVASLIVFVIYVRPDEQFKQCRESRAQRQDTNESSPKLL